MSEEKKPTKSNKAAATLKEFNSLVEAFGSKQTTTQKEKEQNIKLFLSKTADIKKKLNELEAEDELLEVLRFEYQRDILPTAHLYKLNEIEAKKCQDVALCRRVPKTSGMFLNEGTECPYTKSFDAERKEDVYTFFVPRVIEPEEQITRELDWKMKQGFMPEMKDYPPAKLQYRRFSLRHSEFTKYFDPKPTNDNVF